MTIGIGTRDNPEISSVTIGNLAVTNNANCGVGRAFEMQSARRRSTYKERKG